MGMSKKIKILLAFRDMTMADLAKAMHISRSNISARFKRDNWSENDLQEIAEILNSDLRCSFVMRDTGQEI